MSEPDWPLTEKRLIGLLDTSWRTCSHNFGLVADELLRTARNGAKPAEIWESLTKGAVTICRSPQKLTPRVLFIVVRIVGRNSRGCAASAARSRVSPAVENTTAAT